MSVYLLISALVVMVVSLWQLDDTEQKHRFLKRHRSSITDVEYRSALSTLRSERFIYQGAAAVSLLLIVAWVLLEA